MGLLEKIINTQIEQYWTTADGSKSLLRKAKNILYQKDSNLKKKL